MSRVRPPDEIRYDAETDTSIGVHQVAFADCTYYYTTKNGCGIWPGLLAVDWIEYIPAADNNWPTAHESDCPIFTGDSCRCPMGNL